MAIIGVASVRIKPDLSEFRKELKAGLDSIKAEITVKVKADVDPARREIEAFVARQELKDIKKKVDIDRSSLDRAEGAFSGIAKGIRDIGSGLATGILRIGKFAGIAITASAAVSGIVTVVAGLAQGLAALAPAGLATGLGGLLTLATVIGTIKFGLGGIGKAFDALNTPVKNLQKSVESSFQSSFIPAVNNLKTVIPQLKTPLQEVATAVGGVATKFTAMLKTSENMSLVKSIIENSAKSVQGLGNAVAPLGHAFLEVGAVASDVFRQLTQGAGKIAQTFADKISAKAASGELRKSMENGIQAVEDFYHILVNIGHGISNVFHAIFSVPDSGSFLKTLSDIAQKFRDFTELDSTKQIFGAIGDTIRILSGAFFELLKALGPVFPVLADTAKVVSGALAGAVKDLAPLIADVAKHFLEIIKEVAPKLVPIIEKVAGAFLKILDAALPLVDPLVGILDALTPMIDPIVKLVQTLVPPLVGLLKALAPLIEAIAKALGKVLDVIGPVVGGLADLLALGIGSITDLLGITGGNPLGDKGATAVTQAGKLGEKIGKEAADRMGTIFRNESLLLVGHVMDDVLGLLGVKGNNVAIATGLIGKASADAFGKGFETANNRLQGIVQGLLNALGLSGPNFDTQGRAIANALNNGLSSQQQALIETAQRLVDAILGIFTGKKPAVQSAGAGMSAAAAAGFLSGNPALANAAQTAANTIVGVLNPVSLFNVGNRIGNSLAAGLQSAVNAVKAVLSALTLQIPLWKGPPAVDKVLLKPAGIAIMQGLIDGVVSQQGELQRVLGTVTDQFTATTDANSLAASLNSALNVSSDFSQPEVNVNVGFNDPALKDIIDVRIDEGNRQTRRAALTGGAFV